MKANPRHGQRRPSRVEQAAPAGTSHCAGLTALVVAVVVVVAAWLAHGHGLFSIGGKEESISPEEALTAWMVRNGATAGGLRIANIGDRRGIVATRPIKKGEELFKVPARLILKSTRVCKTLLFIDERVCVLDGRIILALFLVVEQTRPGGFWRPYVRALPRAYDSHSIWVTEDDLSVLDGTAVRENAVDVVGEEKMRLQELKDIVRESGGRASFATLAPGLLDDATLEWAYVSVTSRCFASSPNAFDLVPFVDMMNSHPTAGPLVGLDNMAPHATTTATGDYAEGEEVFLLYHEREASIVNIALNYGYVERSHIFRFGADFNRNSDDPLLAEKRAAARAVGCEDFYILSLTGMEAQIERLLSCARIACGQLIETAEYTESEDTEFFECAFARVKRVIERGLITHTTPRDGMDTSETAGSNDSGSQSHLRRVLSELRQWEADAMRSALAALEAY